MIDSERGRCNANVPFHLPDALEDKFLGCIPDHHQLRIASYGTAMAVQAGLGWGGVAANRCVSCMRWWCCVLIIGKVWRIIPCVYKIYTLGRFQFHNLLRRNLVVRVAGGFWIQYSFVLYLILISVSCISLVYLCAESLQHISLSA